eukprot:CAMPEP_0194518008 /NCGR_PEP_ID=MMETSP0253-20130528/51331_1 /TAXON_ID=2966 /ORGANISM="Noctiluca scintillans" /LENGTH=337 /DNA_ID=CAMNT_0039362027 /DNA_START=98 /DNA_END=1111 /DNA_ORIENTATION=-
MFEVWYGRDGTKVLVRLATSADHTALVETLQRSAPDADPGSQVTIDDFDSFLSTPDMLVLWAESAEGALGMLVASMPTTCESYIHSIRVAPNARNKGIAAILFKVAARLCVRHQGAGSVGRWGVPGDNTTMLFWSDRHFSEKVSFTLYKASTAPSGDRVGVLPSGWSCRYGRGDDISSIMAHLRGERGDFAITSSGWGTARLVSLHSACALNVELLGRYISGEVFTHATPFIEGGLQHMCPPLLVFDGEGALVGLATMSVVLFAGARVLWLSYVDGSPCGLEVVLKVVRHEAAAAGCAAVCGYLPTLDLITTATNQDGYQKGAAEFFAYSWKNQDEI